MLRSWRAFQQNFATKFSDLENLKPSFAFFFVNPLVVDVVKNGCPVQKPIVTQTANIEAELLDLQQDFALKSVHKSVNIGVLETGFC